MSAVCPGPQSRKRVGSGHPVANARYVFVEEDRPELIDSGRRIGRALSAAAPQRVSWLAPGARRLAVSGLVSAAEFPLALSEQHGAELVEARGTVVQGREDIPAVVNARSEQRRVS